MASGNPGDTRMVSMTSGHDDDLPAGKVSFLRRCGALPVEASGLRREDADFCDPADRLDGVLVDQGLEHGLVLKGLLLMLAAVNDGADSLTAAFALPPRRAERYLAVL